MTKDVIPENRVFEVNGEKYVEIKDFAFITNRSSSSIYNLINKGNKKRKLKSRKVGSTLLVLLSEFDNFPFYKAGEDTSYKMYVKEEDTIIGETNITGEEAIIPEPITVNDLMMETAAEGILKDPNKKETFLYQDLIDFCTSKNIPFYLNVLIDPVTITVEAKDHSTVFKYVYNNNTKYKNVFVKIGSPQKLKLDYEEV